MNSSKSIVCKNCGNVFEGNYCNNCRQKADTNRIDWKEVWHGLFHAFFHTDRGLLFTIRELILRPGITIREYLDGKRASHFNPLLFLILSGTVASLLFSYLHIKPPNDEVALDKIEDLSSLIAEKYFILIGFFFIFLLTITDYFFYYTKRYLIPEIIISNAFQIGQLLLYTVAMVPLFIVQNYIFADNSNIVDLRVVLKFIVLGFLFFTRYQLYEASGNLKVAGKIVFQLCVVYILYHVAITQVVLNWLLKQNTA
jgi:hypothetical protein